MKLFSSIILSVLCVSTTQAQTVVSVTGTKATADLKPSSYFAVGDEVQFLQDNLDPAGEGKVLKVSAAGAHALIEITSGKVVSGMTFEAKNNERKKSMGAANFVPQGTTETSESVDAKSGTNEVIPQPSGRRKELSNLTDDEREILERGEISSARYIVGGILGSYPLGFGLGHLIQGRYLKKGYIFTLTEAASVAAIAVGISNCNNSTWNNTNGCTTGLILVGVGGLIGFHVWEIVDLWAAPPKQNRRYRELRTRLGLRDSITFTPAILPTEDGKGGLLAL